MGEMSPGAAEVDGSGTSRRDKSTCAKSTYLEGGSRFLAIPGAWATKTGASSGGGHWGVKLITVLMIAVDDY